jgi:DNA-binding NarL/FixJ family response regulator
MTEPDGSSAVLRVLLVDDQQLMREGLRTLLEMDGIAIVGEAADGAAAVQAFEELSPDVVLMDIRMPKMDGVEATRRIRGRSPGAKILILTTFDEDELVFEAVRDVAGGGAALQPGVARKVMDAFARLANPGPAAERHLVEPLSGRERAVLGLLARGLSNKEIDLPVALAL